MEEWCVASEDCAFGPIGYERVRDVLPGEMIVVTEEGATLHKLHPLPSCWRLGTVGLPCAMCVTSRHAEGQDGSCSRALATWQGVISLSSALPAPREGY